jgi:hypothetical protein
MFFFSCPTLKMRVMFLINFTIFYSSASFQLHFKSERRVSNPQPPAWKAGALPIELLSLMYFRFVDFRSQILNLKSAISNLKSQPSGDRRIRTSEDESADLQSAPFGHSGISPKEPKKGLEPPTY